LHLSLTGRLWEWPQPVATPPEPGVPAWLGGLLARRGIEGPVAVQRYLEPSLTTLDDPGTMADMPAAAQRLAHAVVEREPITVYGDYDVDGVCSTSVLVDFLQRVGANVGWYIPDRRAEGYGLNESAVRDIATRSRVLVTADCGVTAAREVTVAKELGLDVIIVDHHRVPDTLPPALACLDPHRPDCAYPFKGLCATGVAFMVVGALRRALRAGSYFGAERPEPDIRELLDLVAIATVADMVPVVDTNRVLLAAGLRQIAAGRRPGLAALLTIADVDASRPSAGDIAFRIAPRINARGRMSHAAEAVELMLTKDVERARQLAAALDAANKERRRIEEETLAAALLRVESDGLAAHPGVVVSDPTWHPGVLGLVATRLVQRFHRPAIVIGEGGKGSGRTVEGVNLHDAMAAGSDLCLRFGGHSAAAGLTIEADNVPAFRERFGAAIRGQLGDAPYVTRLRPDLELTPEGLTLDMVADLERLGPFGQQNPQPLFVARDVRVRKKKIVGDQHLKLVLGDHEAIAFRLGGLYEQLPDVVDVAFRLEKNVYNGRTTVQLEVEDLRATGP
jgi:single-stranded-DNA-specific exonuclease